jgi:hypothetical protein
LRNTNTLGNAEKGKQKVPVYGLACLPVDSNGLDCTCVALFVLLFTSCVNKPVVNHGEGPLLLRVGPEGRKGHRSAPPLSLPQSATRLSSCWLLPSMLSAAPRANGASGQAEDILVPVWGFPALRAVPRLARCVRFLSSSPSLRTLASIADVRTFDLVWCLDGEWIGLVASYSDRTAYFN